MPTEAVMCSYCGGNVMLPLPTQCSDCRTTLTRLLPERATIYEQLLLRVSHAARTEMRAEEDARVLAMLDGCQPSP